MGLVAGTEDSTPLHFAVALDEASYLQLDDVVVTVRDLPGGGHVATGLCERQWGESRGSRPSLSSPAATTRDRNVTLRSSPWK